MGLSIVLIFWAFLGVVAAVIAASILSAAAGFFTRGVGRGRRRVVSAAAIFPFLCLGWAGALFIFQAFVNEGLLHRDLGIGDTWHCPLPNGYQILFIDVTDQGTVYNPKTQPDGGVVDQDDSISGARLLQVSGPYMFAGVDTKAFDHLGTETDQVDSYIALDSRVGREQSFSSIAELRSFAAQSGTRLRLEPIYAVYSRYRFTWFDVVVGVLFFGVPVAGFMRLLVRIVRLRNGRASDPQPFAPVAS